MWSHAIINSYQLLNSDFGVIRFAVGTEGVMSLENLLQILCPCLVLGEMHRRIERIP